MFAAIVEVVAMLMFIVFCIAILLYAIRRTQSVKYKTDAMLREYYKDLKKNK